MKKRERPLEQAGELGDFFTRRVPQFKVEVWTDFNSFVKFNDSGSQSKISDGYLIKTQDIVLTYQ